MARVEFFNNMSVCKQQDEFNREKPCWVAHLSSGETIYQDDDRPGESEPSSWIRLRSHCQQENYSVVDLHIRFWDHVERVVPPNSEGYFFVKKVQATAFSGLTNNTRHSYLVGALKDDKIHLTEWLIPEIVRIGSEIRDVVEGDPKLIINGTK